MNINVGQKKITLEDLKQYIRDVPDFPKKGIIFKDITTLLKEADLFKTAIDKIADRYKEKDIDLVVSIESRGFIFGAVLAYKLNAGFVPVRKKGKLPAETISASYELEYGLDTLELHKDAIVDNKKVLIVDDLLATGGTVSAVAPMVKQLGGELVSIAFLIELTFLNGRDKLKGYDIFSLIKY